MEQNMKIDTSLRVVARAKAKPDQAVKVREILGARVEPTRREPGCLSYELLQNNTDPTDFVFVEQWASASAEQAHFATSHIESALQQLVGLLAAEPQISQYRLVK